MLQFIFGLLFGIAIGMWVAILLYRYSGKVQPGWPFRSGSRDGQSSASRLGPSDDYDEAYYAAQERMRLLNAAAAAQARADAEKRAQGSVVYTDTRSHPTPQPSAAKTQEELDAEFDAVASGDWPDEWDEEIEAIEEVDVEDLEEEDLEEEARAVSANEPAADDPRVDDYTRLIMLLDGDVEAAEARIEAERNRTPAVARSRLIENALLRLQYEQT